VLWKVPCFLDMKELITLFEGLFLLQTQPSTNIESALCHRAGMAFVVGYRHRYDKTEISACLVFGNAKQDGRGHGEGARGGRTEHFTSPK
jgi:hypothetical protein